LIHIVPETGSTNADLAARVRAGDALSEGYWLVADRQTGGRGRQGRAWEGGTGNFMGSTLVRIGQGDPPAQTLAFLAGLAVIEALRPYCDGLRLKWPNDVLLGGAKLAGILLEAEGDAVIVGIGVNLVAAPPVADRPVACLPKPVSRDVFAKQLAETFAEQLARWRAYGVEPLLTRWSAAAHPLGEMLSVHEPGGARLSGTFAGLDPDGALLLRLADGSVSAIHAGDVTIEGQ
jgi:BirA family biotin operon repressor/biotin-[acetyl-CoA-carboxylase] ligase